MKIKKTALLRSVIMKRMRSNIQANQGFGTSTTIGLKSTEECPSSSPCKQRRGLF